jgi:hypothetical protein
MNNKCKCGTIVPDARIKALKLSPSQAPTCINCAQSIKRVAGFPLITGKNTYSELQLVSQEEADMLFAMLSALVITGYKEVGIKING